MRRRQYLKASAVAATAGLAGCSGVLGGGGGGPAGVAKNWIKAGNNGNEDKMEDLTHSDSPMSGFIGQFATSMEETDISVNSTEVIEEGDEEATVEVTTESEGEEGTTQMVLQTEDGSWKVWSFDGSGGGGGGTTNA